MKRSLARSIAWFLGMIVTLIIGAGLLARSYWGLAETSANDLLMARIIGPLVVLLTAWTTANAFLEVVERWRTWSDTCSCGKTSIGKKGTS